MHRSEGTILWFGRKDAPGTGLGDRIKVAGGRILQEYRATISFGKTGAGRWGETKREMERKVAWELLN